MRVIVIDSGFQLLVEMAEQEEPIKEFFELTGQPEDCRRFFLEGSGWNLQVINCVLCLYWSELSVQVAQETYFDQSSGKVK